MKLKSLLLEVFNDNNHTDILDRLYDILYNEADEFISNGKTYEDRDEKLQKAISKYMIYSKTDKEKQQANKEINTELDAMIKSYKKDINDKVKKLFKQIDKEVSNIKKHTK
jgi:F0F1-type ATP synthase membrane subunit b/b'|tara:strand:- start:127 stop:459 length:333 start_codon:yes stop_codon:yes gene_type:complete